MSGDTTVAASCAAAALLIGTLVYFLIRPDAAAFVPRALHRPLLVSPVIADVARWLPTLCHVLGFSLATALVTGLSKRAVIASAAFWVAVNALFELGQHPALRVPLLAVLRRAGESGPVLLAQEFFRNGAFDPGDIVAALAAGTLAILLAALRGRVGP